MDVLLNGCLAEKQGAAQLLDAGDTTPNQISQ